MKVRDLISRQDAIDATYAETVSTNPEHFKSNKKFIEFMDDIDISDFGRWQWANGFNTALVATRIQLEKLSSAEPEEASVILGTSKDGVRLWYKCSVCGEPANADDNYCCNCGRKFINGRFDR